jgi:arabinofuranosyltransferase
MEWVAVVASLAASVAAFAVAARATRRFHPGEVLVVPVGLLMVAAVPVVWDFATAGLETGATWLWLAGCWLLLSHAGDAAGPPVGRTRVLALVVLGFGPLVRPDLAVVSVCVLAAWWLLIRPTRAGLLRELAIALALPFAYQIFRMGYYASLVPNTALAKDASGTHLEQGVNYLRDLLDTYWLYVPLAVVAFLVARTVTAGSRPSRVASAAMVGAGVLHAGYMVLVGGDYLHGRLLLPALFAVALPAVVELPLGDARRAGRRPRLIVKGASIAVVAVWAVVCMTNLRFVQKPSTDSLFPPDITDWRIGLPPEYRVVIPDRPNVFFLTGEALSALAADGRAGYVRALGNEVLPAETDGRLVAATGAVGVPGYRAGIDVWIVDQLGLGEPLAARSEAIPGRPAGHRKQIDEAWYEARWGVHDPADAEATAAAAAALECGDIGDLVDAVSEPLTPGLFLSNIWNSVRFTGTDVPADPREAPTCES